MARRKSIEIGCAWGTLESKSFPNAARNSITAKQQSNPGTAKVNPRSFHGVWIEITNPSHVKGPDISSQDSTPKTNRVNKFCKTINRVNCTIFTKFYNLKREVVLGAFFSQIIF